MIGALLNALKFGSKLQGPAMSAARALPAVGAAGKTFAGANAARPAAQRLLEFAKSPAGLEALALYGPDAFNTIAIAANTPGDMGDKLIAGISTGGSMALGGYGARKLLGGRGGFVGSLFGDMVGGEVGYHAGNAASDALLRAKGGGTTPYEKLDADYRRQLEQQILAQHGLAGYTIDDMFLAQNGLA